MPHIVVDYSRNLEDRISLPGLLACLRDAAVATGIFPLAGIRVRAIAADHVLVADGAPGHAYLDITVKVGAGRDGATLKAAKDALFAAAEAFCRGAMDGTSLMLSMELRVIDPDLSDKTSSIRRYLPGGPR